MSTEHGKVFQPLGADDPAVVGSYRLAALLGSGGMGKVYLSYTPAGRPVAIKVIRPEFAEDPEFRRRFRQEVQAAQRVQGLYTAPVIESDADAARPWLATAFVQGPTLSVAVAEHGALPTPTVLLLVAGIAEALQAVHAAGLIHRDLKPSNVLLAADGPRVIDFGIARAADATSLTDSGVTIGTPAYMSPEQAAGREITTATDVFALGQVAAYAALAAPAYGDGPSHAVLYRIVHEEPDLSALPAELRPLVTRCLTKDPAQRPSLPEIVGMCQAASDQTQLMRPEQWLPGAVAADIPERHALPAYTPTTANPPDLPLTRPDGTRAAPPMPAAQPVPQSPQSPHPPVHPPVQQPVPPSHQPTQTAPPAGAQQPTQTAAPLGPRQPAQTPPPARSPSLPPPPAGVPVQQQHPVPASHNPYATPVLAPRQPRSKRFVIVASVIGALLVISVLSSVLKAMSDNNDDGNGAQSGSDSGTHTSASSSQSQGPAAGSTPKPAPPKPEQHPGVQLPAGYHLEFADDNIQPRESNEDDFYYGCDDIDGCTFGSYSTELVLLDQGEQGSLQTCLADTRYTKQIDKPRLSAGSEICARTTTGSIVLLKYRRSSAASDASQYVVFDVTIWRNAIPATE